MIEKRTLEHDNSKLEALRLKSEGLSNSQISSVTGIPSSTLSDFFLRKSYSAWWESIEEKPIASGSLNDHRKEQLNLAEYDTFIITSAQNNTYCHTNFVKSLEAMRDYYIDIGHNPLIIVGTFTYNVNGFQNGQKDDDDLWFDPMIEKHILDRPARLCDGLLWCGELNILPTAVTPLSGFQSYTKGESGIIPHAKMQLESVPTHRDDPCKMLYTTGACTKMNYIQKKSGQKAQFDHIFGGVIVEVDNDGDWFVRQIHAERDTGIFYDLNMIFTPSGYDICDGNVEGVQWGDLHSEKGDIVAYEACFGQHENSILDTLKPKYQFFNDIFDHQCRNHHNISDPYFRFKTYKRNIDTVEGDIGKVVDTLKLSDRDWCQSIVVESNHDLALSRWLKNSDYKNDPANAIFYLECQLQQYLAIERGEDDFSIFEWAVKKKSDNELNHVRFLKTDEKFLLCDEIESGQHGHLGNNGARGSIMSFMKLGTKYNVGHAHSAAIRSGVFYAGHLMDRDKVDYAKGGSSWSQSSIITYINAKRQIITLKNGKWRRF